MNEFLIGLQFLTRISIVKQTVWTEESFGKSVKYFPIVGAVLGMCYAVPLFLFVYFTDNQLPFFTAALTFFLMTALTGGIHCDGLMDTADGLFSGREREKMLEIMKDSRAGAFGVVSLVTVAALEISAMAELVKINPVISCIAIYTAPIIGRLAMVFVISNFSYARPEGIGKAFSKYATMKTFLTALIITILFQLPLYAMVNETAVVIAISLMAAIIFSMYFGKYATNKLGGVTGDIYGAVEMLSEVLVIIIFLFATIFWIN